jgi:flagellar biosynthetic protein FliR
MIQGVAESFKYIPLLGAHWNGDLGKILINMSGQMFVVAVKISAPVFVTLLLTNVGLGIVARTLPQMNVFIVGFPLQIGLGLATLAISIPMFYYVFEKYFNQFGLEWMRLIRLF